MFHHSATLPPSRFSGAGGGLRVLIAHHHLPGDAEAAGPGTHCEHLEQGCCSLGRGNKTLLKVWEREVSQNVKMLIPSPQGESGVCLGEILRSILGVQGDAKSRFLPPCMDTTWLTHKERGTF